MLLDLVVPVHDVQVMSHGVFPQSRGFRRRILPVVIQVHEVIAGGMPPSGQDGIVLAEIACVLDVDDGHAGAAHEVVADLRSRIGAAVVDEHDLMAARDGESLDLRNDIGNRLGTVIERDDETQRWRHCKSIGPLDAGPCWTLSPQPGGAADAAAVAMLRLDQPGSQRLVAEGRQEPRHVPV